MVQHRRSTFVEGIGDDLIYGSTGFLGLLIPVIIGYLFWWRRSNEDQTIHPESQENVNDTRTRLQGQSRNGLQPTAPDPPEEHTVSERRCPICIDETQYAIETNCGHVFCGMCIVTYWRHGAWLGAVRCPVCRQVVMILLLNFTEEERTGDSEDKRDIVQNIRDYNRRFSGEPRTVMDYLRDLPTLLRHCLTEFFSLGGLIIMFRIRVILCFLAALLYFISPLDIIPEAAFGLLGFLDDFFIMLLFAIYVSVIYRQFVAQREAQ